MCRTPQEKSKVDIKIIHGCVFQILSRSILEMLTDAEKKAAKACKQVWFDKDSYGWAAWGDENDPTNL